MVKRFKWTPEQDEKLIDCIQMKLSSTQAAKVIGISPGAVKKRSVRIGVHFKRWGFGGEALGVEGHIPADERSGELLRAAGVQI